MTEIISRKPDEVNVNISHEDNENLPRDVSKEYGEKTIDATKYSGEQGLELLKGQLAELKNVGLNPNPGNPEDPENPGNPEDQNSGEASETPLVTETIKKAKKNRAFKIALAAAAAIAVAGIIIGVKSSNSGVSEKFATATKNSVAGLENPVPTKVYSEQSTTEELAKTIGEKEPLKLKYDYSEWSDFENKSSHNAYGADYSDCYGDSEKTTAEFLKEAEKMPEALASYENFFFEDEQKELGIADMGEGDLEEYMSDVNSEDAATMQQKMLDKMNEALADKENTRWGYEIENKDEKSRFVVWEDENSDGIITPDEMHLGYSVVSRRNAPQAILYRKDKDGNWSKRLDLNLYCGFQPNTPTDRTVDVPFIQEEETPPSDDTTKEETKKEPPVRKEVSKITPKETPKEEKTSFDNPIPPEVPITTVVPAPERGKSGDPHGGPNITPSDYVNPETKVTKEQNKETNQNHQGYINDNQATPGSASENNGVVTDATAFVETEPKIGTGFAESGITASNANNSGEGEFGQRIYGNENQAVNEQGSAEMAGENTYYSEEANKAGQAIDQAGNAAQAAAWESLSSETLGSIPGIQLTPETVNSPVGQDNYTNEAEEAAVASGDF